MTDEQITKILGMPITDFQLLLRELLNNNVATRHNGAITSRRMLREREVMEKKSKAGKKGMRMRWQRDNRKRNRDDNTEITGNRTYSSSSSSSPSMSKGSSSSSSPTSKARHHSNNKDDTTTDLYGEPKKTQPQKPPDASAAEPPQNGQGPPLRCTPEDVRTRWNAIDGLRPCALLDGDPLAVATELCRTRPSVWWDTFFTQVRDSPMLRAQVRGKDGREPYPTDLAWALAHAGEILAGQFAARPRPKRRTVCL
jgi:hypothetical protein